MQEASESPFLEPFVRSLVLGLGAAVVLECTHELLQVRPLRDAFKRAPGCLCGEPPTPAHRLARPLRHAALLVH